jgi:hypothetical protein
MSVSFPEGISALGNGALWYAPAVAVKATPVLAEFTAGINMSCGMDGFAPTGDQGSSPVTRYCSTTTFEAPGRATLTGPSIEFVYDPQDPASAEYEWYVTITEGTTGFLINRLGLPFDTAIAADQVVNVFPITAGVRIPVPVDPTADGQELRYRQRFFITGAVAWDAVVAAA